MVYEGRGVRFSWSFFSMPDGVSVWDLSVLLTTWVVPGMEVLSLDVGVSEVVVAFVDEEQSFGKEFLSRLTRSGLLDIRILYREGVVAALPNIEARARYIAMLGVAGLARGLADHKLLNSDAMRLISDFSRRLDTELGPALVKYRERCEREQLAYVPNLGKPADEAAKPWVGKVPFSRE